MLFCKNFEGPQPPVLSHCALYCDVQCFAGGPHEAGPVVKNRGRRHGDEPNAAIWGERVTTVFPKQGHYAFDPKILTENPPADIELAKIGDLLNCDLAAFLRKQ